MQMSQHACRCLDMMSTDPLLTDLKQHHCALQDANDGTAICYCSGEPRWVVRLRDRPRADAGIDANSSQCPWHRLLPAAAMLLPCSHKTKWMVMGEDLDYTHQPSECEGKVLVNQYRVDMYVSVLSAMNSILLQSFIATQPLPRPPRLS